MQQFSQCHVIADSNARLGVVETKALEATGKITSRDHVKIDVVELFHQLNKSGVQRF